LRKLNRFTATIAGIGGLTLLLSAPVVSAQNYRRDERVQQYGERVSMQGRVRNVTRDRDGYRVYLDRGSYWYYVPSSVAAGRDLRIGTEIRIGGVINGNLINADVVAFPGERYYTTDPYYNGVPAGQSGWLHGIVRNVNRRLGYVELIDDAGGGLVRVDLRNMSIRGRNNVWDLRRGDRVNVRGTWERGGLFEALRIEY
jgi:hypothetical protein